MSRKHQPELIEAARRLIEVTAHAWQIRPQSPQAMARRAPHGYVSQRMLRRLHAANDAMSGPTPFNAVHA